MTKTINLDLSKMRVTQVMDAYEKECLTDDDTLWENLYEELCHRPPFEGIFELIETNERRMDVLEKLLKQHQHQEGMAVIVKAL